MQLYKKNRLLPFEWLAIIYAILTAIIILIFWKNLDFPLRQIANRIVVIGIMLLIVWFCESKYPKNRYALLVRILYQIGLLPFWYPDIYEFNKLFPNLDHVFANLEQSIFGFQPAIEFSEKFSSKWFSEAVYLGYFAYYPMIVGTVLYGFFVKQKEVFKLTYIIMGGFFVFYLLFIFIPVAGPQFYFLAIGPEQAAQAVFPAVGDYFKYNIEIMAGPGYTDGFFYHMIELVQAGGERPIAAFPSSHVGVSTLLMIWLWTNGKRFFLILTPFYLLLCAATVYVQAHYLIDVFAGWMAAFLFYFLMISTFRFFRKKK